MPKNESGNINKEARLLEELSYIRGYTLSASLAEAALWAVAVLCASMFILLVTEKWFYLPALWKIAALTTIGVSVLTVAAWKGLSAVARFGGLDTNSRELEKAHPSLKTRLSAALEFCQTDIARHGQSPELMLAAVAQAVNLIASRSEVRKLCVPVLSGVRRRSRIALWSVTALATAFMLTGASDPLVVYRALESYSHPLRALEREQNYRILVRPGNRTIIRGDSLTILAVGTIGKPGGMSLGISEIGKPGQNLPMDYTPDQFEHTYTLESVQNDFQYHVTSDGVSSDTFNVTVTNNPFVTELSINYRYPSYTSLEDYTTTREKSIQGLRGSRVVLSGRASNPLDSAWLRLEPDSLRPLAISDQRSFNDTLVLSGSGSYSILLLDRWGLANSDTLSYPISVIPDERPAVALRHPRGQADLNEEMIQPLVFELADDYGVLYLRLNFRRIRSSGVEGEPQTLTLASWRKGEPPAHVLQQYNWDLNSLGLLPEDEVAYSLTVFDNDIVSGPKAASTAEYRIRFPSLEEIFDREQNRQEQITTDLRELEQQGEQIQEQVKKLNEAIERGEQLQWEDNQQLSRAVQQQREMLEQVKKLSEDLQQSMEQMQRGEMMSSELLEKMQKVQQLMAEVATDELKEMMGRIQQSIERMDQKALEEAMAKFEVSQEEILQKLEKTLALLERLKLEQKLDNLVRETEEIARAAQSLADSTGMIPGVEQRAAIDSAAAAMSQTGESAAEQQGEPDGTQADSSVPAARQNENDNSTEENREVQPGQQNRQQQTTANESEKASSERMDQLAESTAVAGKQTETLFNQIDEATQQFGEAGELETAAALMQESVQQRAPALDDIQQAIEGYRQGQPQQSYEAQSKLMNNMQNMHQRMQQYREELQKKWRGQVAEAFKRAFDQLNYLSENQEAVMREVKEELDFNHPDILAYAAREQEIVQGLDAVRLEISGAAKNNFFVSAKLLGILYAAVTQGDHSTEQLSSETRQKVPAVSSLERSLMTINAGMLTLLQDEENLQQSSSGTGMDQMLQQMEQMAQRQQQLNQAGQDALRQQQQQGQGGMQGSGMSGQGQQQGEGGLMEMLSRMAAEQEAIRQQLEQMAAQAQGRRDMMGNSLEGAAREAGEVVKELMERGLSSEVLERQNRIFNRLLDAQRAIQERESGRQRKAERPEDYTAKQPGSLPPELLESENGQDLLRQQMERWQGGYPESYRSLIRSYYELLKTKELEQ